jgi:ligand-binding sensor domain-containing protein/signal transduction histidine kinase
MKDCSIKKTARIQTWGDLGRRCVWAGRSTRSALAVALLLGMLAILPAAGALEPSTPLASYARQSWGMENGLPQNTVQTLLQSRDGFVWLGTEVGLVRFDGNSFVTFDRNSKPALPSSDIRCLLESSDGALWIGTSDGLARMKDGGVTNFTTAQGLPGSNVRTLVEDQGRTLWVWTDQGLARLAENRFVPGINGLPNAVINFLSKDENGILWTSTPQGFFLRDHGQWGGPLFTDLFPDTGADFHSPFHEGQMAVASKTTAMALIHEGVVARMTVGRELPGSRVQTIFVDHEGAFWIGTNQGLVRWSASRLRRLESLPVTDPLATASILSLMEDREGNLWVGTETGGLHILRDQRFQTMGAREGLSSDATTAVVEDAAGTLWVGTSGGGLNSFRPSFKAEEETHPSHKNKNVARVGHPYSVGSSATNASASAQAGAKVRSFTVRGGLLSDVILSLAAAPNGDLWVGTPDGLNRIHAGRIDAYTSADGLPDDFIRSLLCDSDGSLWIGTRRGLTHWVHPGSGAGGLGGKMETLTQANGLGSDLVGALTRDAKGDLWVATLAGLSRIGAGKIVNFTTANGLSSNVITALLALSNGNLLIGTQDHGWNQWDGMRFTAAVNNGLGQAGPDRINIHAILDDGAGHLWFATGKGIARCNCSEMNGVQQKAMCSNWIEFGPADGLRSRETATNSHPSAWRSRDGRLWFATPKGLVEVDPAHFPINATPPPVALERFLVDDVESLPAAGPALRIAAGHVHFQFDYAGLSFTAPQKVRYRFMLEGFDRGWTEAGARRTAYYTNIPPGKYTFRVQAANNDGVWNTVGAVLAFELRPHFYQTGWFLALLLAAAMGAIFVGLRLRLQRAEGEFRAVLGERSRIAREIHDTLAQGYVGISVQLEVLAELLRMNKPEAAAQHLDVTRGYVREGLAEARQSIWALRSPDSIESTLPVKMRRLAEAENGSRLAASFSSFGAYRPLPAEVEQEFLRVAQEAIHNVKKHAGATTLTVQLEYTPAEIALEVRDDGRGFAAGGEHTPGHFGLTGMRERAAAIGGRLEMSSEPGAGTTVRLVAPTPAKEFPAKEFKEQS